MTTEVREKYTPDHVARIAREIYECDIRGQVDPEHRGEYLVIDILTGRYLIDADDIAVSERGLQEFPNGVRYEMWIGHDSMGRI